MEITLNPQIKDDNASFLTMKQDGVLVMKNQISSHDIHAMQQEISKIRKVVAAKIATMDRPLKTYSDIAERQLNRLDYRCGFTANIFKQVAVPITNLIKTLSPTIDFRSYWGAIPSLPGSGPTDLHRDTYPVQNTCEGNDLDQIDIQIPPFYFTVLIPLVEITRENGPTEFVKGSHRLTLIDESRITTYSPLLSPGDFVVFDGRTLHRGASNHSQEERLVAYITYVANWYHDQTFVINSYLFPELDVIEQ